MSADPLTLLLIASSGLQAVGNIQQANAESSAAQFNAQVADQNENLALSQAKERQDRLRRSFAREQGALRAGFGKAGVSLEGSPLEVLENSAREAALEIETAGFEGLLQARGFRNESTLERSRAKNAKTRGVIGAGTALLSGATNIKANKSLRP